jgi:hypothetical protein
MAGFSNITSDESILYADNASFDGTERGGKMITDGQLWIGATASPHVRLGSITSTAGTIVVTNSAGSINLDITGGAKAVEHLTADSGGSLVPDGSNNFNLLGGTNGPNIVTAGSGSTITFRADILTYIQPGAYPYAALSTDYYIAVDSSAARTINLPNAPTTRKSYVIKDRVGTAAANNITITTPGGVVLIDGAATFVISTNYGAINVIFNGTKYEVF